MLRWVRFCVVAVMWLCVACGSAPSNATSVPDPFPVTYTVSGGIQGAVQTMVVNQDGTLVVLDQNNTEVKRVPIPTDQLTALRGTLTSADWQQLRERYGQPVPDAFMYTIDAGGKQVTTYDGAQHPAALANVLTQLNALLQQTR